MVLFFFDGAVVNVLNFGYVSVCATCYCCSCCYEHIYTIYMTICVYGMLLRFRVYLCVHQLVLETSIISLHAAEIAFQTIQTKMHTFFEFQQFLSLSLFF